MQNFLPRLWLKQKNKLSNGFTLVETLVAISIFTMSILGLMSVLASGISNINYATNKMAASYLAQEGIEYVRNIRDTDSLYTSITGKTWDTFKNANVTYPSSYPDFTRTITMTEVNPDEVRISSSVSWTQGSGNYNTTFSENLFNWIE